MQSKITFLFKIGLFLKTRWLCNLPIAENSGHNPSLRKAHGAISAMLLCSCSADAS
ncbi:MAG: hypothetical protein ACRESZ_08095 [Methylococcales bacterium]